MLEGPAHACARSERRRVALAFALSGSLHAGLALAPEQGWPARAFATVRTQGEIRFLEHASRPPARSDGTPVFSRGKSAPEIVHDGPRRGRAKLRLPASAPTPEPSGASGAGAEENFVGLAPKVSQVFPSASEQADPSQAAQHDADRGAGGGASASEHSAGSRGAPSTATGPRPTGTAPIALDSNAPPDYPRAARRAGLEGVVIARILVGADGRVAEVHVLAGPEIFHNVVREALLRWRYVPARRDGFAVAATRTIELPFSLR